MVIKIFYVAIAIFSVAMVFLSLQDPYLTEAFKKDNTIANMEMIGINDYEIGEKINLQISAKSGTRYKDYDEFNEFSGIQKDENSTHILRSNIAIRKDDELIFKGNANYQNSDNINYNSEEIIYNTNSKIVSSNVPFVMWQGYDSVSGDSIKYDINKKQTSAKGIKAWYFIKETNSTR
ncbi:MAG: LPS export ABC transporter periplasmic protein LptC [Campylobacter sp.]|nr:LPS export ABC transporter periplasmic protein LptC [Campylobacter sp.]